MGKQRWEANLRRIEEFWSDVDREVEPLATEPEKLCIYQDGLPCAGELDERIDRETAAKRSRNYQIIQRLMDRGARIEATESPVLLKQEYSYIKALLEERDVFID